jgi:hypothetical protein
MTKTVPLKNSTAVEVVKSPKLPATKREREYGDFDAFVVNADKLVAFFSGVDKAIDRLVFDDQFEWVDKPDHYGIDLEREKQKIHSAKYDVESARHALSQFPQARKRLAAFKRDVKWYDRKELYEIRGKGKRETWTLSRRVVTEQIAVLLASFPNSRPGTPKVFGRMLTEEVYANNPNACTLESACRRVRREKDFPPSIAEVLKAIDKEGDAWCNRWALQDENGGDAADYFQRRLENAIAEAEPLIAEAEAKLAEREAKEKAAEEQRKAYREAYQRIPVEERRAFENGQHVSRWVKPPPMPEEYLREGHEREALAYHAGFDGKPIPGLEVKTNGAAPIAAGGAAEPRA